MGAGLQASVRHLLGRVDAEPVAGGGRDSAQPALGIALALGRRSNLPILKLLCVAFIEIFRGVPLITLLFMSQVLVPLAFPEEFPRIRCSAPE